MLKFGALSLPVSSASTPHVSSASTALTSSASASAREFSIRDYQELRVTESTLREYFDYLLACFSAAGTNTVPTLVLSESITPPLVSINWSQVQALEGELTHWRNRIRALQQKLRYFNIHYEAAQFLNSSPPPLPSNARPQLYSPPRPPSSPPALSPPALSPPALSQRSLSPPLSNAQLHARPQLSLSVSECREQLAVSLFTGDRDTGSTTLTSFLKLVERVVDLGDNMYGMDRAYRWMASWIGAKCAVTLGVSTYGPAVSWEAFIKAFREEFDPEEREYKERVQREPREQRRTHFNNDTEDKVVILEKRVVLLERHIMRVEQELRQRAFPTNGGSSNGGSGNGSRRKQGHLQHLESPAWRDDDIHSCRICLVVFESGSQLHKHLRQSKHFSPAASSASSRQSSHAPTLSAFPSPTTFQKISIPPSLSNSRSASPSPCHPTPPPSSPGRSQSTPSPTPSALPSPVSRLVVSPPPPCPALPSPASQPAASPTLRKFGAITPLSPGLAPSRSSPGAKEMYESDNESTETMDLETQLEAVFMQIQEIRWTSLSGDRLPVLHPPDDVFEPWDVDLISSFDQQTHPELVSCS
ncbi:hypothetical protein BDD12DRAFT_886114 [Trichophaea hybrida]|nr:hypothetical protein BDD12DRAFT_886114 [Trichophaea hybrida]